MKMQVSVNKAREQFIQLLKAVEHGEQIDITRRGRVVAQLILPKPVRDPALGERAAVRAKLRDALPPTKTPSMTLIRDQRVRVIDFHA